MKIRPTFEYQLDQSPEEVRSKVKQLVGMPERCDASVLKQYAQIRVPPSDQHYWSPQLNVQWDEHEGGTQLKGRFGPRPSVWTLFAGFYMFSIFIGGMGLIFGGAQKQLDLDPWALWAVPVSAVCLAVSYTIAFQGQKLGHDQMHDLEATLQEVVGIDEATVA